MPFSTIAGHRPVVELLSRAVARQTLPPSLVFSGPDGVGKRLTAIALAQALNCERRSQSGDGCGTCASCTRIARGVHADVLVIEPGDSGTIKIEQVREAIDRAAYRPFEGKRRVVIIEEADALFSEAQNALLKTLEEPPPASVFVPRLPRHAAADNSVRCQRRFGKLSGRRRAVLVRDHGFAKRTPRAAAAAADGSIGHALDGADETIRRARRRGAAAPDGSSRPGTCAAGSREALPAVSPIATSSRAACWRCRRCCAISDC
jgi:DNA polymerase-3 subunit delta'